MRVRARPHRLGRRARMGRQTRIVEHPRTARDARRQLQARDRRGAWREPVHRHSARSANGGVMTQIRVALVDDHPVVLAGIAALLQSAPDICVVGSAANGADALALIEEHAPDLAVIDISLPDMSGVSLAQTILAKHPEIRIITLTVHESRAYVQSLLLAGVKGYVLKRAAADDLIRAVRAVAAGGVYLDPSVAE